MRALGARLNRSTSSWRMWWSPEAARARTASMRLCGRWNSTGPCMSALPTATLGPLPGREWPTSALIRPNTLPLPRKYSCARMGGERDAGASAGDRILVLQ